MGAFSEGSGADDPGVPGNVEPCRGVASPVSRFWRFSNRASSISLSFAAEERRAMTTSLVILLLLTGGALPPSETGVGSLFAEENEPSTY